MSVGRSRHRPRPLVNGVQDVTASHLSEVHYAALDGLETLLLLLYSDASTPTGPAKAHFSHQTCTQDCSLPCRTAPASTRCSFPGKWQLPPSPSTSDTSPMPVIEKQLTTFCLIRLSTARYFPSSRTSSTYRIRVMMSRLSE